MIQCAWHLCTKNAIFRNKFCSPQCKNKYYVNLRRLNLKLKAVKYLGGACILCGYNACMAALDFHHKDPSTKEFGIRKSGHTQSWAKVQKELKKCILVCNRCHVEIHTFIRTLKIP